jgi:sulfur-oxidizing protein SoxY
MNLNRRSLLKKLIASSAIVLMPMSAIAKWLDAAFKANNYKEALTAMGSEGAKVSDKIKLKAPEIAENGAVVPIRVSSTLENIESINLLVVKNPKPLTAQFKMFPGLKPDFKIRLRMSETSKVVALVKAGGQSYMAESEVKVTIGGCGG